MVHRIAMIPGSNQCAIAITMETIMLVRQFIGSSVNMYSTYHVHAAKSIMSQLDLQF